MAQLVPQDVYQSLRFVVVNGDGALLDRAFPILVEARFEGNDHPNEVLIRPVGGDFEEDYFRLCVSKIQTFDIGLALEWITANRGSMNLAIRNALFEMAVVIFQSPQAVLSLRDNVQQADIQNIDLIVSTYVDNQGKEWPEFNLEHWLYSNNNQDNAAAVDAA